MSAEENKVAELEAKVAQLEQEKAEQEATIKKSLSTIEEISAKLDLHESSPEGGVIVKVGSKSYRLVGKKFIIKGKEVTAEELAKDKETLAAMAKGGSGILAEAGAEKGGNK